MWKQATKGSFGKDSHNSRVKGAGTGCSESCYFSILDRVQSCKQRTRKYCAQKQIQVNSLFRVNVHMMGLCLLQCKKEGQGKHLLDKRLAVALLYVVVSVVFVAVRNSALGSRKSHNLKLHAN